MERKKTSVKRVCDVKESMLTVGTSVGAPWRRERTKRGKDDNEE